MGQRRYCVKLVLLILCSALLVGCSSAKLFKEQRQFFDEHIANNPDIEHASIESGQGQLHYARVGDRQLPVVVFIHGTPGSWQDLSAFFVNDALRGQFQLYSIDRPGWGLSEYSGEQDVRDFSVQAQMIALLLQQIKHANPGQPVILMGHSLGASIAPFIARDFPQLVDALLLVSGSHDSALAKPRLHHHLGQWPIIRDLIGSGLRQANTEMLILDEQLEVMQTHWQQISIPVTAIQGEDDPLVHPKNLGFLRQALKDRDNIRLIELENTGHFTHIVAQPLIAEQLLALLALLEARPKVLISF